MNQVRIPQSLLQSSVPLGIMMPLFCLAGITLFMAKAKMHLSQIVKMLMQHPPL